jgi:alkylresorcinol/alkylpyrone synthase
MSHVLSARSALPGNYYTQGELMRGFVAMSAQSGERLEPQRVQKLFGAVRVGGRHLALPLERYATMHGFAERNREWLRVSLELGERALLDSLAAAGLAPSEVKLFVSSSVTGVAVPSIEARLMNRLRFSPDCRRMPLFGLGCVAGAAGLSRITDYLRANPRDAAVLLCVELCSLTFQPQDTSVANIIACGLFGDGAACVVMVGSDHPLAPQAQLTVQDSRSVLFPDTEEVMGWDIVDSGFGVVLTSAVPELARTGLASSVRTFLTDHALTPAKIGRWIAHPGGPAVMDAMERGLELGPGALDDSRECLARIGNLSSASVLVILEQALAAGLAPGNAMLLAMGPGFCAELLLLQC